MSATDLSSPASPHLYDLPTELVEIIVSMLTLKDKLMLREVCRCLNACVLSLLKTETHFAVWIGQASMRDMALHQICMMHDVSYMLTHNTNCCDCFLPIDGGNSLHIWREQPHVQWKKKFTFLAKRMPSLTVIVLKTSYDFDPIPNSGNPNNFVDKFLSKYSPQLRCLAIDDWPLWSERHVFPELRHLSVESIIGDVRELFSRANKLTHLSCRSFVTKDFQNLPSRLQSLVVFDPSGSYKDVGGEDGLSALLRSPVRANIRSIKIGERARVNFTDSDNQCFPQLHTLHVFLMNVMDYPAGDLATRRLTNMLTNCTKVKDFQLLYTGGRTGILDFMSRQVRSLSFPHSHEYISSLRCLLKLENLVELDFEMRNIRDLPQQIVFRQLKILWIELRSSDVPVTLTLLKNLENVQFLHLHSGEIVDRMDELVHELESLKQDKALVWGRVTDYEKDRVISSVSLPVARRKYYALKQQLLHFP